MRWSWSEDGGRSIVRQRSDQGSSTKDGPANDPTARRIAELEQGLADLQARLPAHSIQPAMMAKMEEIEDELARLQTELKERDG